MPGEFNHHRGKETAAAIVGREFNIAWRSPTGVRRLYHLKGGRCGVGCGLGYEGAPQLTHLSCRRCFLDVPRQQYRQGRRKHASTPATMNTRKSVKRPSFYFILFEAVGSDSKRPPASDGRGTERQREQSVSRRQHSGERYSKVHKNTRRTIAVRKALFMMCHR